jgi:hypothetical protein
MFVAAFSPDSKGFYAPGAEAARTPAGSTINMLFRQALMAAVAVAVANVAAAQAQSPFPDPRQQASPFPDPNQTVLPGQQPARPQPQEMPACIKQFISMRENLDKRFDETRKVMEKKPSAAEACNALTKFTQTETALIKYVEKQGTNCPFPPELLDTMKASSAKTTGYRQKACAAAKAEHQGAPRPSQPTLSDAFGPPVVSGESTRTGRGTLDSLSGNPLAR